jgi:hypothetical protein
MRPPLDSDRAERERLAREDIEEWTEMLRSNASWSDLRDQLAARGADPSSVLLAAFMESEDCEQFGAVVIPGRRVLAFKRSLVPETLVGEMHVVSLVDITDNGATGDDDAMATALKAGTLLSEHLAKDEFPPAENDPRPWFDRLIDRLYRRRR